MNSAREPFCHRCWSKEQNRAEAQRDRFCEDFHDGGSTQFKSLADQQAAARKLK